MLICVQEPGVAFLLFVACRYGWWESRCEESGVNLGVAIVLAENLGDRGNKWNRNQTVQGNPSDGAQTIVKKTLRRLSVRV